VPFCLSRPFRPQVPLCPARTVGEVGSSIRGPYRAPVTWRTRAGTKRKDAPNAIMPSLNYLVRVSLFIEYRGRLYFCSSLRAAVRGKRVSPRRRGGGGPGEENRDGAVPPPPVPLRPSSRRVSARRWTSSRRACSLPSPSPPAAVYIPLPKAGVVGIPASRGTARAFARRDALSGAIN